MMSDIPKAITIKEEGPREGFQIEKNLIPTERKIEFIDALSNTGLKTIQIVSFVNPKKVPNMADAEEVVAGITPVDGVEYIGLYLNDQGFQRAVATGRLSFHGTIGLNPSETFSMRNTNTTFQQQVERLDSRIALYKENSIPITAGSVSACFGCNFEGDISDDRIMELVKIIFDKAEEHDLTLERFNFLDTMAWATPARIKQTLGRFRNSYPDMPLSLHLHDTRGMGIANAYAGLEMGVDHFDACVGGLGGCPFAGHAGAAGNVCTEDLVFMCEEMGIETGLDLEALRECANMAEEIVDHPLPGSVMKAGSLDTHRKKAA